METCITHTNSPRNSPRKVEKMSKKEMEEKQNNGIAYIVETESMHYLSITNSLIVKLHLFPLLISV